MDPTAGVLTISGLKHTRGRQLLFLYCGLYFAIDLAAQQQHQSAEIKPRQQNNHGAQRTVGGRIVIEVMNVQRAGQARPPASPACPGRTPE